jgi:hypothetical protein
LLGVFHGDDAVATPADVRASWRARKGAAEGEEMDREREEATRGHVQKLEVELGVRHRRRAAAARAEQRGSGGARGRRSREVSGGLVCNSQKFQGPFYQLKFFTATKVK